MTNVIIVGIPQLQRRLTAIGHTRSMLQEVQIRAVREAKLKVARKTGFTGRTIRPGEVTDHFAIVEAGGAAEYLEFGTRPHIIRPRSRRVLAWPANESGRRLSGRARSATRRGGSGGMRFATLVHHPGTKPQPFLVPAAVAALQQVGLDPIVKAWNDGS